MFSDNFFNKIEKKTNVNKETILSLADKLKDGDMKNEKKLREVIHTLSDLTGKNLTKENEDKIIEKVLDDKVPKNIDKMI